MSRASIAILAVLAASLAPGARPPAADAASPPGSVVTHTGIFRSLQGEAHGEVQVNSLASGGRELRFSSSFRAFPYAGTEVHLSNPAIRGSTVRVGTLARCCSTHTFAIPASVNLSVHRSVLLWQVSSRRQVGRADLRPVTASQLSRSRAAGAD